MFFKSCSAGYNKKRLTIISIGKDIEKLELSYFAARNVK